MFSGLPLSATRRRAVEVRHDEARFAVLHGRPDAGDHAGVDPAARGAASSARSPTGACGTRWPARPQPEPARSRAICASGIAPVSARRRDGDMQRLGAER
jgi:hypothetical protein